MCTCMPDERVSRFRDGFKPRLVLERSNFGARRLESPHFPEVVFFGAINLKKCSVKVA